MENKDIKVGDLVKIHDGSYAVKVSGFEPNIHIGTCRDPFEVVKKIQDGGLNSYYSKVHDIFIKNTVSGEIYLHSVAFVSLLKRPCSHCGCCCCR